MSWWDAFTVVDVETSGLDADENRVLELGFARFERGALVDKANYIVYAPVTLDAKLKSINGLTQDLVDAAKDWPFHRVWEATAGLFEGAHPVAFNAPFDRRFVQAEIRRHRGLWSSEVLKASHVHEFGQIWIDPLPFVRHVDKYQRSKKLTDACARRGIEIVQAHQAVWDCVAAGELLLRLAHELPADTQELLQLQLQHAVGDAHSYAAYKARKNGQKLGDGCVFICDVCHERAYADQKTTPPRGWAFYKPTGSDTHVTCSIGCDAQMLWWNPEHEAAEGKR